VRVLSDDERRQVTNRLRRVIGQAEGTLQMVEDGRSCVEVLIATPEPPRPEW